MVLAQSGKPAVALEIKSSGNISNSDAYGLLEFKKENPDVKPYIIAPVSKPRLLKDEIMVLPWEIFFKDYLPDLVINQ